jgi:hypothetical protein
MQADRIALTALLKYSQRSPTARKKILRVNLEEIDVWQALQNFTVMRMPPANARLQA